MGVTRYWRPKTIRRMQSRLYPETHGPDSPKKFRAIATWWRLHALESAMPDVCEGYAKGQLFIAADMENRPRHHTRKPLDRTRWQWSQAA